MKVLVATAETQGKRKNDFCYVPEGELVNTGVSECSREPVDGHRGCRRSFCGLKTPKATTTAKVIESVFDRPWLEMLVRDSLTKGGWISEDRPDSDGEFVREVVDSILHVAAAFEPGMVVERRGTKFQERLNGG